MNNRVQERSSTRWIIAGAGSFGRECAEWIIRARKCSDGTITFIDDDAKVGAKVAGRWRVAGPITGYVTMSKTYHHRLVVGISDPIARRIVVDRLGPGHTFTRFETDMVATTAKRGKGLFMCPGAVISAGAEVGEHVHMNLFSKVGHDAEVGDFCTLACDVDIMGGAFLEHGVKVGSGARVLPGIQVGAGAVIGAGAVVMLDVPKGATVAGNPARRM